MNEKADCSTCSRDGKGCEYPFTPCEPWSGTLTDPDGLCLRHDHHLYLEPCRDCEREYWDNIHLQRDFYRGELEKISQVIGIDLLTNEKAIKEFMQSRAERLGLHEENIMDMQ